MSETPREPEYHLNFEASTELAEQLERAKQILSRLAFTIAGAEAGRPPDEDDLVEGKHVIQAAEALFGRIGAGTAQSAGKREWVFISHASGEEDFAIELAARLKEAKVSCFVAKLSIESPGEWAVSIWDAIRDCRVVLALITAAAKRSKWCAFEVMAALGQKKPVVPVLLHATELPQMLEHIQALKAQTEEQKRELVKRLVELCSRGKSP